MAIMPVLRDRNLNITKVLDRIYLWRDKPCLYIEHTLLLIGYFPC